MNGQQVNVSLLQDLAQRLRTDDVLGWIEKRTTELARLGWKEPGYVNIIGPRLLAECGIGDCVVDTQLPSLATLTPRGDGSYVIRHHVFSADEDHRFWIAHEVAHTFWILPDGSGRPLSPHQCAVGSDPNIEWLCNRAAAALLVPRGLLEALLRERGYKLSDDPPPVHLLESFARKLRVTPRLLARRWFHDILGIQRNVVCLATLTKQSNRLATGRRFRIVWEAIFSTSVKLTRKLQGRVVPQEALPTEFPLKTEGCRIDARWLSLVSQARGIGSTSTPFTRIPPSGDMPGLVSKGHAGILLSFVG